MNFEDEKIIKQFNECFIDSKENPIVIYGIGAHTKELLRHTDTSRIVGLMDKKETGNIIYEKPVLSMDEVTSIKDVIIVILARKSVINVIFRRIEKAVTEKGIPVFDVNGNRLLSVDEECEERDCFRLDVSELKTLIESADCVSFDIFDTLLCRSVYRPTGIFDLVGLKLEHGQDFKKLRVAAEEALTGNYNYDDIYDQLEKSASFTDVELANAKNLEIELEKRCQIAREKVCEILEYAHGLGKKVILISDMYFSKEQIEVFLREKGINRYDGLYVSCDMNSSKTEELFEKVREAENLTYDKWVHIGDNEIADIEASQRYGIKTFRLYSTMEMLEQSRYAKLIDKAETIEGEVAVALFAANAFNNPFGGFDARGKLHFISDEAAIQTLMGPIISKFMRWIIQSIKKDEIEYILFPSRDGFLLKSIYDEISNKEELPGNKYLYTSRRAAMVAAAFTKDDINNVLEFPDDRSFAEIAKSRFGVDLGDVKNISSLSESDYNAMLKNASEERKEYMSYLEDLSMKQYSKIAFIDFVAMGRIQNAMEELLEKQFMGFYFLRRIPDCKEIEKMQCKSFLPMADDFSSESNVYKFYYFLENILSSNEPSLMKIENGKPVFYEESRSSEEIEKLMKCHEAIRAYCQKFFDVISAELNCNEHTEVYDMILSFFSSEYSSIENSILLDMANIDEFMGKTVQEFNR